MNTDISNSIIKNNQEILNEKMIEMVMRQTDYNYDETRDKLEAHKWDYEVVIRKFMGIEEKVEKTRKTVNQEIFKQIRNHMDSASSNFYK